jgi:RNA polymerase sigma-70 factor (ECF subfamily)
MKTSAQDCVAEEVVGLFDRFRNPLLHYLASFGFSYADGEEVIQEAFLSLFHHLRRERSRENLPGWLFRVSHNLALKRRYRAQRECPAGSWENAPDPGPTPEAASIDGQTRTRLLAVVRALPEQDRRCLFLRAEGLRYREIAGILGMSLGAVALSLSRSFDRLSRVAERR